MADSTEQDDPKEYVDPETAPADEATASDAPPDEAPVVESVEVIETVDVIEDADGTIEIVDTVETIVTLDDGNQLRTALAAGPVTVRMQRQSDPDNDGSLDGGERDHRGERPDRRLAACVFVGRSTSRRVPRAPRAGDAGRASSA